MQIEYLDGNIVNQSRASDDGGRNQAHVGGRLVERIEGDYLNVVGLPGALLVSILERHAPKLLQTRR